MDFLAGPVSPARWRGMRSGAVWRAGSWAGTVSARRAPGMVGMTAPSAFASVLAQARRRAPGQSVAVVRQR
jgi:hypothetical protein